MLGNTPSETQEENESRLEYVRSRYRNEPRFHKAVLLINKSLVTGDLDDLLIAIDSIIGSDGKAIEALNRQLVEASRQNPAPNIIQCGCSCHGLK